jgi:hypothetical protein
MRPALKALVGFLRTTHAGSSAGRTAAFAR